MKTPEEWYDVLVNTSGRKERAWLLRAVQEEALQDAIKTFADGYWKAQQDGADEAMSFEEALSAVKALKERK